MSQQTQEVRERRKFLVLRALPMPKDLNANGDIFGGWIVSLMDIGAGLLAAKVCRGRAATVTIDKLVFEKPVHVGEPVSLYARLERVGNTSMDIAIEVWKDEFGSPINEGPQLVTEAVFRYVAIDEQKRPRRVPDNPEFFTERG